MVDEHANRLDHLVDVVGRLAHSHEDDVLDRIAARALHPMCARPPLMNDLVGAQILEQAHLSGLAKPATHRAADLARNAKGRCGSGRARHRNEHALGLEAVPSWINEAQNEFRSFALNEGRGDGVVGEQAVRSGPRVGFRIGLIRRGHPGSGNDAVSEQRLVLIARRKCAATAGTRGLDELRAGEPERTDGLTRVLRHSASLAERADRAVAERICTVKVLKSRRAESNRGTACLCIIRIPRNRRDLRDTFHAPKARRRPSSRTARHPDYIFARGC